MAVMEVGDVDVRVDHTVVTVWVAVAGPGRHRRWRLVRTVLVTVLVVVPVVVPVVVAVVVRVDSDDMHMRVPVSRA